VFSLIRWLLLLAFTVLLVSLAVVNRHLVVLSLYPIPYEIELPLYLFSVIFFMLGLFAAGSSGLLRRLAKRRELRRNKKQIHALESELASLRSHTPPTD